MIANNGEETNKTKSKQDKQDKQQVEQTVSGIRSKIIDAFENNKNNIHSLIIWKFFENYSSKYEYKYEHCEYLRVFTSSNLIKNWRFKVAIVHMRG